MRAALILLIPLLLAGCGGMADAIWPAAQQSTAPRAGICPAPHRFGPEAFAAMDDTDRAWVSRVDSFLRKGCE